MDTTKLKLLAGNLFSRIRAKLGVPLMTVIIAVLLLLTFIYTEKYFDRRSELREDARFSAYEKEADQHMRVFQNYIEMANRDHETTTAILDAMGNITKNINLLAENDRRIDERVNQISEGEYKDARNQKNNQKAVADHTDRSDKPLGKRIEDVLANDRELFKDR